MTAKPNAETQPRSYKRGVGHLAHADEHDAVAGCSADRTVGAVEFRLAARKQQRLSVRHDYVVKPVARRVGSCNRDAVCVCVKNRLSHGMCPRRPPNGGLTN